jgi:hypothetical protein
LQAPEAERLLREAKVQRGRQPFFGQRVALHVLLVGDRQLAEQLQRVRCHAAPAHVACIIVMNMAASIGGRHAGPGVSSVRMWLPTTRAQGIIDVA